MKNYIIFLLMTLIKPSFSVEMCVAKKGFDICEIDSSGRKCHISENASYCSEKERSIYCLSIKEGKKCRVKYNNLPGYKFYTVFDSDEKVVSIKIKNGTYENIFYPEKMFGFSNKNNINKYYPNQVRDVNFDGKKDLVFWTKNNDDYDLDYFFVFLRDETSEKFNSFEGSLALSFDLLKDRKIFRSYTKGFNGKPSKYTSYRDYKFENSKPYIFAEKKVVINEKRNLYRYIYKEKAIDSQMKMVQDQIYIRNEHNLELSEAYDQIKKIHKVAKKHYNNKNLDLAINAIHSFTSKYYLGDLDFTKVKNIDKQALDHIVDFGIWLNEAGLYEEANALAGQFRSYSRNNPHSNPHFWLIAADAHIGLKNLKDVNRFEFVRKCSLLNDGTCFEYTREDRIKSLPMRNILYFCKEYMKRITQLGKKDEIPQRVLDILAKNK